MTDEERKEYNREKTRRYRARKEAEDPNYNYEYRRKKALQSRRRKHWLGVYKTHHGCDSCGWKGHPAALDFDHIDPEEKSFHIAQSIAGRNIKTIINEVRKCRVLCANCHRIHSYEEAFKRRKYD